jgi:hypothetical protein
MKHKLSIIPSSLHSSCGLAFSVNGQTVRFPISVQQAERFERDPKARADAVAGLVARIMQTI